MEDTKSHFDYEAILQACGIQDVNVKKAVEDTSKADAKFREELQTLKKLTAERDEKKRKLSDLKQAQKKHLHKLKKVANKMSCLNKEQKLVRDDIASLHLELQNQSDDYIKRMNKMDEELKALYAQFEGATLDGLMRDVDNELLYHRDMENQFQRKYDEMKSYAPDLEQYERLPILKTIIDGFPDMQNLDEIDAKIAEKKKNIQFLEVEYNKKMELLQKFK